MRNLLFPLILRLPLFEAPDGGAGGTPPADPSPANPPADPSAPPAAKWWQGSDFTAEEQQWLAARGLTEDDMTAVMPKLVKGHRAAEQRIGKGLDNIMDRPAKDQKFADWARANAAALGLPDKEDGYAVEPPKDWPKGMEWNAGLEAQARKLAFDMGVPPEAHQAYVGMFAAEMRRVSEAATADFSAAQAQMMTDLQKDYGDQTPAVLTRARQAASMVAEKAGISGEGLEALTGLLADKLGDAGVIRMFNAIGELGGEDVLVGRGDGLSMTPAEARAEIAKMSAPGGDWYQASATGNRAKMKELQPRMDFLSKLAAR
jgi:hypothetical protein